MEGVENTDTQTDVQTLPAEGQTVTESTATAQDQLKAGVDDFEKAWDFVKSGVEKLGDAAEAELKELAKKYL
ncbi:hypothetical protein [Erwinia mallotivora]|uniref:hypothetical protein n=1 Tax=Erwinia mallotivora TaxID=69222 RepID=UPI0021BF7CF9|nr:hypothetical protein [Erwinia mallotivora]